MHMTCQNCKYEFCWLCMGDYKNHSKETGRGLCNSFDDVKAAKRAHKGDIQDRLRVDRKMRKFAHYATRYKEHLNAVKIDTRRGSQLQNQIEFILSKCGNRYVWQDFAFIQDIVGLILKARRSLANTYPIRFFMSGPAKKRFFDFMQGELEISLERLSKMIVKDITDHIEMGEDKTIFMRESFSKFKHSAGEIKHTVEDHFKRILAQIKADFPDISEDPSIDDSSDEEVKPGTNKNMTWSCYICTNTNNPED